MIIKVVEIVLNENEEELVWQVKEVFSNILQDEFIVETVNYRWPQKQTYYGLFISEFKIILLIKNCS